jgi:hypothetical protein
MEMLTGGTLSLIMDTASLPFKDFDISTTPFLRKLAISMPKGGNRTTYYEHSDHMEAFKRRVKNSKGRELLELKREPEYGMIKLHNDTKRRLAALYKVRKARGGESEIIEQQIDKLQVKFNRVYNERGIE